MALETEAPKTVTGPRLIADAGPLIALATVDRLGLLERLFGRVYITPEVELELRIGHDSPGTALLEAARADGWLVVLPSRTQDEPHPFLDAGEASCLAAAGPDALLLMDGRLGRREAVRLGVSVVGTAGVLCAAKKRGYIRKVVPILQRMRAAGYFLGDAVIGSARAQANE